MKRQNHTPTYARYLALCCAIGLALWTMPAAAEQIQVLLFGHPCQLGGPAGTFSSDQLLAIHRISPEQTPSGAGTGELSNFIERLKAEKRVPEKFSKYRSKRIELLEKRLRFEEAVTKVHRTGDRTAFAEATTSLIHPRRHPLLLRKLDAALKAGPSQRAWDEVREIFVEFSGPDGEEEFHRTLRQLQVHYQCAFEDDRAEEKAAPASAPVAKPNP